MKNLIVSICIALLPSIFFAQAPAPDTVEIDLSESSKIMLMINDREDLDYLREIDFAELFDEILDNLEDQGAATEFSDFNPPLGDDDEEMEGEDDEDFDEEDWSDDEDEEEYEDDEDDEDWDESDYDSEDEEDYDDDRRYNLNRLRHFFNMDLGMNNYLHDGEFTDPNDPLYTVRSWGSWYIGLNGVHRLQFSPEVSLEGTLGVSWYNFKFNDDDVLITESEDGVVFQEDPRDLNFTKSKLTVSYLNASAIVTFHGGHYYKRDRCEDSNKRAFRVGAGPYIGYRLGSYAKQQFLIDGDKEFERERDNFYLNNIRYGVRLQMGIRDLDFFINYDLNELFVENRGPKLNAYSFGVIF